MQFRKNILFALIVILTAACFAQDTSTTPAPEPADEQQYPYIAEVTGTDVQLRSGSGTAYYPCGKLNAPDRVQVIALTKRIWLKVLPPLGSFSWISAEYIDIDPDNTNIGILNGNAVRVYAGSEKIAPMYSASIQTLLNKGDIVKLVGEKKDSYCKIEPPHNAYLYVSKDYIKYVGPVPEKKPFVPPTAAPVTPSEETSPGAGGTPAETETPAPAGEETKPPTETPEEKPVTPAPVKPVEEKKSSKQLEMLKAYRMIAEQIEAELKKPLEKQNYDKIKTGLNTIIKDPEAGKVKKYSEFQLERIERYEMAKSSLSQIQSQKEELQKKRQEIKKKAEGKLEKTSGTEGYIISGVFKPSQVFTAKAGPRRYIIADDKGGILCYTVAANKSMRFDDFFGKKVKLKGKAVSDSTSPLTIIEFSEIKLFEEKKEAEKK